MTRILVVDDYEDAATSLRDMLELEGHEVHVAFDGASGLSLATSVQPDVVLCDLRLPDEDGLSVGRKLRALLGSRARLVAVTGCAAADDRTAALHAGFNEHFAKPLEIQDLPRVVAGPLSVAAT